MKNFYCLITLLITSVSFGQSPIITAVLDGDCTDPGGSPKVVEIYANGTVDFSNYSCQRQQNGATPWDAVGGTQDLSFFGIRTDEFVYISATSHETIFNLEFPSIAPANVLFSDTIYFNGDDPIRIIETASTTVIDQYGVEGTDGTGTSWEYKDGYAKRNNGTGPDGAFIEANWSISNGTIRDNGDGACQGGTDLETILGIGEFILSVEKNNIDNFEIYPNPVSNGALFIKTLNNNTKHISLFNILGKEILSKKLTTNNGQINVTNLPTGIYILKLVENKKIATRKIVIK